jgi:hypothetical protein
MLVNLLVNAAAFACGFFTALIVCMHIASKAEDEGQVIFTRDEDPNQ